MVSTFDLVCFLLICCFFAVSFSYRGYALGKTDALLLRAAMAFTLLADFCILIAEKNTLGVIFFCCVQFIYNYRFTNGRRALALAALIPVLTAALLLVPAAANLAGQEKAAVVYAACLFFSVSGAVLAFRGKKYPLPNNYLVLVGMLLFFLCDVSVMLRNLDLPQSVVRIAGMLIWVFYLPSQFMLSLSARKSTKTQQKKEAVIMLIKNDTYEISINAEHTFTLDSVDNKPYDLIINPFNMKRGDYYKALAVTLDDGVISMRFIIIGEMFGADEDIAILENDDLIILMNTMLIVIDCRTVTVKLHKKISGFWIYFSIYKFDDGYIIYGEIDILKLSSRFEIEWSFSGADIFVSPNGETAFKIENETIFLSDWNGRKYKLNKFGQEISDISNIKIFRSRKKSRPNH